MKKILLTVVCGLIFSPFMVSADSYDGPFCYEPVGSNLSQDTKGIRGTCKFVDTISVVSLDPALQKDYFLGTHMPIVYGREFRGSGALTKFSEDFLLTSSSTLSGVSTGVEIPLQYALFDKSYFTPLLERMFKDNNLFFSEKAMPEIIITVLKKAELDEVRNNEKVNMGNQYATFPKDMIMDSLIIDSLGVGHINTLNYFEYGKHVYAPKGDLVESQYVDVENGGNMLSNEALQIEKERPSPVVPVTSPLKAVTNYWLYTKKDGKLVLVWQKSEYTLDNGKVKTITNADKNVSAALLFGDTGTSSANIATSSQTDDFGTQSIQKRGFLSRFFNLIFSWFK